MTKQKDRREIVARALCRHDWQAENTVFDGKPMWTSYLGAADAVLKALDERDEGQSSSSIIARIHPPAERQQ